MQNKINRVILQLLTTQTNLKNQLKLLKGWGNSNDIK